MPFTRLLVKLWTNPHQDIRHKRPPMRRVHKEAVRTHAFCNTFIRLDVNGQKVILKVILHKLCGPMR
jgi:hypothetical protein